MIFTEGKKGKEGWKITRAKTQRRKEKQYDNYAQKPWRLGVLARES